MASNVIGNLSIAFYLRLLNDVHCKYPQRGVSTSTQLAMNDHVNDKHSFQDTCLARCGPKSKPELNWNKKFTAKQQNDYSPMNPKGGSNEDR